jgi:hypothetical protein
MESPAGIESTRSESRRDRLAPVMALRKIGGSTLVTVALIAAMLIGVGCAEGSSDEPHRALKWGVERQVGPKAVRVSATIETCTMKVPPIEPVTEYSGNRVYIELREPLEGHHAGCFLGLIGIHRVIKLKRELDEVALFDLSTHPPTRRWPRRTSPPGEGVPAQ